MNAVVPRPPRLRSSFALASASPIIPITVFWPNGADRGSRDRFLWRSPHAFHQQHGPALAEHDLVTEPNRHGLRDALTIQVGAVLAFGIAHHQTAARADGQLGVHAGHGRVVRVDRLDFAFPAAAEADAGAARLESLARSGDAQGDPIGAVLGLFGASVNRDARRAWR